MNAVSPPSPVLTKKDQERILRKTRQEGGCLVWTGYRDKYGYGYIKWRGRPVGVHRLVYAGLNGPIPPGLEIDHTCHNHPCISPEHLRPRSRKENAQDKADSIAMKVRRLEEQMKQVQQELASMRATPQAKNDGSVPAAAKIVTDATADPFDFE